MNQTITRSRPKPRYSLVTRRSRHGTSYGVYDRTLECEFITGPDRADALAEIRRRIQQDDDWSNKPQWTKSATAVAEKAFNDRKDQGGQ